ncbi:type II toxin-antitoxin system RelE/ParE family toxin [Streptococcus thoraltensis]
MVSDNKTYSLIIPETVQEQLRDIKSYIETTYFSEQAGANTVNNILHGLERLELFPEAGFNADERVGTTIYPPYDTRCIVLGEYLAFYHILEDRKAVFVSDIIHSKRDYIRLFKKK